MPDIGTTHLMLLFFLIEKTKAGFIQLIGSYHHVTLKLITEPLVYVLKTNENHITVFHMTNCIFFSTLKIAVYCLELSGFSYTIPCLVLKRNILARTHTVLQ